MIGLSLAIFGISFALMQGFLIRLILPMLGDWGPVAFTGVFFAFTALGAAPYLPGAPFLVSAAIMVGGAVLLGVVRKTQGALPA